MARITMYIRLGLTPELLEMIRIEAKRQKVSVNALIRTAVERHLVDLNSWQHLGELNLRRTASKLKRTSLLSTPVVFWSPEEKAFADRVLQKHFDEDR